MILSFPERKRGPRTAAAQAEIEAFCRWVLDFRSRLDFSVSSRGWGYLLEDHGIDKSQFDAVEKLINDCRKDALFPLDICACDEKRAAENLEEPDSETPEEYARVYAKIAAESWQHYLPISFWDFQDYYLEEAVEKIDLRELFTKECAEYHVPIWNAAGWSDLNSRAAVLERFRKHAEKGRKCVLLYCGDHDPAGLLISETIRKNLKDMSRAVGWWFAEEDQLIIDQFGLNFDFIQAHRLTWIDGLITGSGEDLANPRHPDHFKPYVQDYLKKYGARKVEANALVARHEAGRRLCREAIEKYIDPDGVKRYEKALRRERLKAKKELLGAFKAALAGMSGGNGKAR
jgi:hypothetical protein